MRRSRILDANNSSSSTGYDAAGQVTSNKDGLGNVTQYVYDDAGRRTQVIDALTHTPASAMTMPAIRPQSATRTSTPRRMPMTSTTGASRPSIRTRRRRRIELQESDQQPQTIWSIDERPRRVTKTEYEREFGR